MSGPEAALMESRFQPLPQPAGPMALVIDLALYAVDCALAWLRGGSPVTYQLWRGFVVLGQLGWPAGYVYCAIAGGWTYARDADSLVSFLNDLEMRRAWANGRRARLINAEMVTASIDKLQAAGLLDTQLRPRFMIGARPEDLP